MILAIVGLPGSGKSEATEYVQKQLGWPKLHFGEIVTDAVKAQGLPVTQENEKPVREGLREKHGMAAMAIVSMPKIEELHRKGSLLIESFYSWEEYTLMKEKFGDEFYVLSIVASPDVRKSRMKKRPVRPLTSEDLDERDYSQIEKLHQAGPIARGDFFIVNEGTVEELHAAIDTLLQKLQ